jgi:hypothetical protein
MPIGNGSLSSLAQIVDEAQLEGARRLGPLPSEGKGHKFESCRARHDFNNLAGVAKETFIAAEASRKHAEGNIWTDCRT